MVEVTTARSAKIAAGREDAVAFRLIPREEKFYDDFVGDGRADPPRRGAAREMLAPDQPIWDKADEIKEVEHKCDFLTHEIIQRLNRTFVTPLDREDIFGLARSLDDVMDAIDASAALVRLYQIERVRPAPASWPASLSTPSTRSSRRCKALEKQQAASPSCAVEINRLENEADRAHQAAVAAALRGRARPDRDHQVEGDPRLPRGRHRPLRRRRQRARRRRRQARLSRMDANLLAVGGLIARRAGLRLHQRLPRRRELDRDRRLDPRAVARARP